MPKPKTLIKQGKVKKKNEQVFESADDFLAAGVEHEEAAGKWRAGDAVKSLRFFGRAVEVYDQGLQRFPQSLDLAYNKARVQLEVATHPLLVNKLEAPLFAALEAALSSHRYALNIAPENADTLFNTAQVLTTIAEVTANDGGYESQNVLRLLEEALELQSRCLTIQEVKYEETERQHMAIMEQGGQSADALATPEEIDGIISDEIAAAGDQWFAVVEPVTKETLIETVLAQLGTLTTVCNMLADLVPPTSPNIAWIEEFSTPILKKKLPELTAEAETSRQLEVGIASARLMSAILEAGFRQGSINLETYKCERDNVFGQLAAPLSYEALLAKADSLISFEAALSDTLPTQVELASTRWQAFSSALIHLAAAAKIEQNSPDETAKTHFLRGDCSLLQLQLSLPPITFPLAVTNASQLLMNAEVFYRNASKLYQDEDQKDVAALRSILIQILQVKEAQPHIVQPLYKHAKGVDWVREQIQEMLDEGLLPADFKI